MPLPLFAVASGVRIDLAAARTRKLNDQHAFVELPTGVQLGVGDLVVFGLSHPCTMFDKWRVVPVVSSIDDVEDAAVTDLIETFF
jgi:D-serine deaminase-like pyridoxal phosphate-dependent protein